jgi:hypothetical protein
MDRPVKITVRPGVVVAVDILSRVIRAVWSDDRLYDDYLKNGEGRSMIEYVTENFEQLIEKFPKMKAEYLASGGKF